MIAEKGEAFEQPWLEKYRPRVMEDVVGNEDTVGRLQVLAQQGNMPNLILSGPPGTGKTTSVLALARTMLGDAFKEAVLELNASDDRGIEVVRGHARHQAASQETRRGVTRNRRGGCDSILFARRLEYSPQTTRNLVFILYQSPPVSFAPARRPKARAARAIVPVPVASDATLRRRRAITIVGPDSNRRLKRPLR